MEQSREIKALDHVANLIEEAHELRRAIATERALREEVEAALRISEESYEDMRNTAADLAVLLSKRERQLIWAVDHAAHTIVIDGQLILDWDADDRHDMAGMSLRDRSHSVLLAAIDEATGEK